MGRGDPTKKGLGSEAGLTELKCGVDGGEKRPDGTI